MFQKSWLAVRTIGAYIQQNLNPKESESKTLWQLGVGSELVPDRLVSLLHGAAHHGRLAVRAPHPYQSPHQTNKVFTKSV
jgi:hypothetical protein